MYFGNVPYMAWERAGFLNLPVVNNLFFLFASLLFLGTLIFWPVAAYIRPRNMNNHLELLPKAVYWTGWTNSLVLLTLIIALFILLGGQDPIVYGIGSGLKILLSMPLISAILTFVSFYYTARIWVFGKGSMLRRCYYTLLTSTFVILLLLLNYWNLLGFNY